MDVSWLGHAAFRLRGRSAAVVLDPCPVSTGFRLGRPQADIVTISNPAPEHAWYDGVGGDPEPRRLDAPGEYEIRTVLLTGVATQGAQDATPPSAPGESPADPGRATAGHRNIAFVVTLDDVIVAHLGDIGAMPGPDEVEELGRAQVVIIPVGGHGHMDAALAARVINALEPRLVIPMLYDVPAARGALDGVDRFLREMGAAGPTEVDTHINVTRGGLPEHTTVHVLAARGG